MVGGGKQISMNDMALGVEMVESLEDHLKHYFQYIRGYDVSVESLLVDPQRFSQGLKNKA